MAYAQLSAVRVKDAATRALDELQARIGSSTSGEERAMVTRLRWLKQLAEASAQEDSTHCYVTMTPEDFDLIANRYDEVPHAEVPTQGSWTGQDEEESTDWKTA